MSDVDDYRTMVAGGTAVFESKRSFRVLVPWVARPLYRLAQGRVGRFDTPLVALLAANALFTATSACLVAALGRRYTGDPTVGLLGAALYLLNFATPHLKLAGMVDSGEGCLLLAVIWTLGGKNWALLPLWGAVGALAKETFVVLAPLMAASWWLVRRPGRACAVWAAAMTATVAGAFAVLNLALGGRVVWMAGPYQWISPLALATERTFWYVFVWLLPLGVWRLRHFPAEWRTAVAAASLAAWLLGGFYGPSALQTLPRPLFELAGPLLSLSAAAWRAARLVK